MSIIFLTSDLLSHHTYHMYYHVLYNVHSGHAYMYVHCMSGGDLRWNMTGNASNAHHIATSCRGVKWTAKSTGFSLSGAIACVCTSPSNFLIRWNDVKCDSTNQLTNKVCGWYWPGKIDASKPVRLCILETLSNAQGICHLACKLMLISLRE